MRVSFDNFEIELRNEKIGYLSPNSNWSMDYHTHDVFEIHYVTVGSGINKLKSEELELVPDTVYMAPPLEEHKQWTNSIDPIGLYYLFFNLTSRDSQFQMPRIYASLPHLNAELVSIFQLKKSGSRYNQFLCEIKLIELIWRIIEPYLPDQKPELQPEFGIHHINQALTYIHNHLTSQPGIDEIAEACQISNRHLSRLFSKSMNISIHSYIQNERFNWAVTQLYHTIFSIGEISEMMNFSSTQYFCRWFKSIAHVSPGEYRNMQQKSDKPDSIHL